MNCTAPIPNKELGLDLEDYSWGQTLLDVKVEIPIPNGINSRSIEYDVTKNHLKVGLKGYPLIINGQLFGEVKAEESFCKLEGP
ncbi:protein BOBBER 2-like [Lycium ferocissimum]|uniref:protein BOBBER 2-like n=1 Tax=Lycium ferocissimum TaxID=112874 RepID=UPI002815349E|nr:protein BOBBER 2-like [Lycium ferocissimum]